MKKIIAVLAILSIILTLASCNKNDSDIKEIVLGDEVESVVLTTVDSENISCTAETGFYEIFDKVYSRGRAGERYSYIAETKKGDDSKSFTTANIYYYDDFTKGYFMETNVKKEGDDAAAVIEEYTYTNQLANDQLEKIIYNSYTYKDEKAFGGTVLDADGFKVYASEEYPLTPAEGTELADMAVRASLSKRLILSPELFQHINPFETNDKTYNFDEFITREYKLYENYIVFKQTAPFINLSNNMMIGNNPDILYASFSSADCSITQEAYCNIETGEIELIKVYGDTLWYSLEYLGQKVEINVQVYINDVAEGEIQKKIDKLIDYVKANAE